VSRLWAVSLLCMLSIDIMYTASRVQTLLGRVSTGGCSATERSSVAAAASQIITASGRVLQKQMMRDEYLAWRR